MLIISAGIRRRRNNSREKRIVIEAAWGKEKSVRRKIKNLKIKGREIKIDGRIKEFNKKEAIRLIKQTKSEYS